MPYQLSQLDVLEAEAIYIIREVVAEFERPVLLFSGGKDSIVMLRLAEKAFYPARIPFPVMHVDTGHNFPEVLEFRDRRVDELGVQLDRRQRAGGDRQRHASSSRRTAPATASRPPCCSTRWRSTGSTRSSAGPAATRTRPGPRSGSSPSATSSASGTRRTSGPSCGASTTAGSTPGESIRVFPLSNWTELDIWQYIAREGIELPSIYYAHDREVFERDGMLYARQRVHAGPRTARRCSPQRVRYRTVGDASLTAAVRSDADTVEKVIDEVAATRITERGATRGDDKFSEAAMEDRKREGYF